MQLSAGQLEKLSILFLNLAQGLFLAALVVPIFAKTEAILESLKAFLLALVFTYLSLKAIRRKEVKMKR